MKSGRRFYEEKFTYRVGISRTYGDRSNFGDCSNKQARHDSIQEQRRITEAKNQRTKSQSDGETTREKERKIMSLINKQTLIAPKALDLFCGEGGVSVGLHRAGFDVVGVDCKPQKNYPFEFHQADALDFDLSGFDFVWASPPCQKFSRLNSLHKRDYADLIEPTRRKLQNANAFYIIENVKQSILQNPIFLCGAMFDLKVYRHRYFESNVLLLAPFHPTHDDNCQGVGRGKSRRGFVSVTGNGGFGCENGHDYAKAAMNINWMTRAGLSQAIPPDYSEFLGRQILTALRNSRKI